MPIRTTVLYLALLLALLFGTQSLQAAETLRRFILAAGANDGGPQRETLRYAVSDAQTFARLLREMGGVQEQDQILLEEPDSLAFYQALERLRRQVTSADAAGRIEVVVYYSGHADEQGLLLGGQRLLYPDLRRQLETIPADVRIAVLDACASGAITRIKGGRRHKPFLVDASSRTQGYAFLTSSAADEAAQESDRIRASFFTHYMVSGMRGAADVSGDGKVTLGEAYQFAFHETLTRTAGTQGGTQHPAYDIKLAGSGDVVMTDLRQVSAGLVLAEDLDGRFFVRNADQQLVAELYKPAGRPIELGLEPGLYHIQLEQQPRFLTADLHLGQDQRATVDLSHFELHSREPTALRGGASHKSDGLRVEIDDSVDLTLGDENAYTVSFGFFFNNKSRPFHGTQFSILFNRANDQAGAQFSSIGNIAHKDVGAFQITSVFNYAGGDVTYGQLSSVFNWTKGRVRGIQGGGVVNYAGQIDGAQFSSVFNYAGRINGFQGGVVNYAGTVDGFQAGLINIGNKIGGNQFGLINISHQLDGVALGLINYSHDGLFNLNTWIDETDLTMVSLSSGTDRFYTSLILGEGNGVEAAGLGGGVRFGHQGRPIDVAVETLGLARDFDSYEEDNLLLRLRLSTATPKRGGFSLVYGVSLNFLFNYGDPALVQPRGWMPLPQDDQGDVHRWTGLHLGLRWSR
ncbi:MAG: caspase family protein [Candidatus Latescibacteria bacterium]|nr:caspase family protein [Candidatus Latescibacterota bacterium]